MREIFTSSGSDNFSHISESSEYKITNIYIIYSTIENKIIIEKKKPITSKAVF